MNTRTITAAALLALATWAAPAAAQTAPTRVGDFILDYDVPESPAFIALGVAPANVLRAGAAKPIVASLLNQLLTGGTLDNGIAIDFSPYAVFGGSAESVDTYRTSTFRRIIFNTTVSLATVTDADVADDLRFGFGLRSTLWDSRDPLADSALANEVSRLLAAAARAPLQAGDDEVGAPMNLADRGVDLTAAYRAARAEAARKTGTALSAGWGFAGPIHGAIASLDSIGDLQHRLWLAGRWSFVKGPEVMMTTQYVSRLGNADSSLRIGAALRASGADFSFALEAGWDSEEGFLPGISAEARALAGVHLLAALVADRPPDGGPIRVSLRHSISWNRSEGR
jgi:hypothetical protein